MSYLTDTSTQNTQQPEENTISATVKFLTQQDTELNRVVEGIIENENAFVLGYN